jgi:hypothetical protein
LNLDQRFEEIFVQVKPKSYVVCFVGSPIYDSYDENWFPLLDKLDLEPVNDVGQERCSFRLTTQTLVKVEFIDGLESCIGRVQVCEAIIEDHS